MSWPLFYAELSSLYEDTYYMEQMRRDYNALKQTGSARTFAAEFKALAMTLRKDHDTKMFDFQEKLKSNVRTGLAAAVGINDFDTLVAAAIKLDQALFDDTKAKKKTEQFQKSSPSSSSASHRQQPRNDNPPSSHYGSQKAPSQNSSPSGPRPYLTAEEKQRREDLHLCRVCSSDKHFKIDCPVHKAKENKGPSRYPTPASSSNVNANSAPSAPVTSAGKYDPQGR